MRERVTLERENKEGGGYRRRGGKQGGNKEKINEKRRGDWRRAEMGKVKNWEDGTLKRMRERRM